jgi:DNA-binding CsgD family transcriptional regulator
LRALTAEALAAAGRREDALTVAGEAVVAAANRSRRAHGVALRVLGELTGGQEGLERLEASTSVLEDAPARLEHARSLVSLGAALRRAKRKRESREPLLRGLDLAHRCAAEPLEQRAREELAALGMKPRRAVLSGVDSLTASEHRVARMAAKGMSNPEIAQALFVTRKTVEMHLYHAYPKLGVTSREALAEALKDIGEHRRQ